MTGIDAIVPAVQEEPSEPLGRRFVRAFIQRNYFYILSALLMIAGCWLLMQTRGLPGDQFIQSLKALAVLQAYEVLVIVTSFVIVRRFFTFGDAFTLLVVELLLLLDPTFFANSFHTMLRSDAPTAAGVYTNVGCFALVVVKLLIIQRFLRFRLTPAAFSGFCFAAAFVYLLPLPIAARATGVTMEEYYYLLGYAFPLFAMMIPPVAGMLAGREELRVRLTPVEFRWFPRLFLLVPLAAMLAHHWEVLTVHTLNWHGAYYGPILVGFALLLIRHAEPRGAHFGRLCAIDALAFVSILASLPPIAIKPLEVRNDPSVWLDGALPVYTIAFVFFFVYLYAYARLEYFPALIRVFGLIAVGGLALVIESGIVPWIFSQAEMGTMRMVVTLIEHPDAIGAAVWVLLIALTIALRWRFLIAATAFYTLTGFFVVLPGGFMNWFAEYLQALCICVLVLAHTSVVSFSRADRITAAVVAVGAAVVPLYRDPNVYTVANLVLLIVALVVAAYALRQWGYAVVASLGAAAGGWLAVLPLVAGASLPVVLIVLSLVLFAAGVLITFRKEELLCRFKRPDPPPPPAAETGAESAPASESPPAP